MSRRKLLLITSLLLIADQVLKIWVKTHMTLDQSITVFSNWFILRFIENPGAAFGIQIGGEYGKLALSLIRIVAIGLLGYYINKLINKKNVPVGVLVGFSLVLVGALGNMVDSAFYGMIFSESTYSSVAQIFPEGGGYAGFLHGMVVDMFYFPLVSGIYPSWFPWVGGDSFLFFSPVFNLADSYISIGVIYMLLFERKFFK